MCFVGFPDGLGYDMQRMGRWYERLTHERATGLVEHATIRSDGVHCGEAYYAVDAEHDGLATLDIKLTPAARGRGIGTAGMRWAIDEAFTHGATRVFVDPDPDNVLALALYDRLGFRRVPPPEHISQSWDSVDFTPVYLELTAMSWNRSAPLK